MCLSMNVVTFMSLQHAAAPTAEARACPKKNTTHRHTRTRQEPLEGCSQLACPSGPDVRGAPARLLPPPTGCGSRLRAGLWPLTCGTLRGAGPGLALLGPAWPSIASCCWWRCCRCQRAFAKPPEPAFEGRPCCPASWSPPVAFGGRTFRLAGRFWLAPGPATCCAADENARCWLSKLLCSCDWVLEGAAVKVLHGARGT
jgi:hypothetical protein